MVHGLAGLVAIRVVVRAAGLLVVLVIRALGAAGRIAVFVVPGGFALGLVAFFVPGIFVHPGLAVLAVVRPGLRRAVAVLVVRVLARGAELAVLVVGLRIGNEVAILVEDLLVSGFDRAILVVPRGARAGHVAVFVEFLHFLDDHISVLVERCVDGSGARAVLAVDAFRGAGDVAVRIVERAVRVDQAFLVVIVLGFLDDVAVLVIARIVLADEVALFVVGHLALAGHIAIRVVVRAVPGDGIAVLVIGKLADDIDIALGVGVGVRRRVGLAVIDVFRGAGDFAILDVLVVGLAGGDLPVLAVGRLFRPGQREVAVRVALLARRRRAGHVAVRVLRVDARRFGRRAFSAVVILGFGHARFFIRRDGQAIAVGEFPLVADAFAVLFAGHVRNGVLVLGLFLLRLAGLAAGRT